MLLLNENGIVDMRQVCWLIAKSSKEQTLEEQMQEEQQGM
jgi:hypothetical protein